MHFTTAAGLIVAAMTPFTSAASCKNFGNRAIPIWQVRATGVVDIPGKCGGLWDNLNGYGACGKSATSCGEVNGEMVWQFTGSSGCTAGVVNTVWYSATKNQWGSISCQI
ncbi:hypothetical protein GCG54_00005389 [Colletotrichum gloeosporioides]|uniref:Uncharacterized protein n=2 Tax=Colletotrichum gloeosporioides TaxID=474922 RepID=T0KXW0_COLGC|nr:uncharacterized protein CGCS363_v010544 [Colletotrichum siamense]XP_037177294.1 uncharacterized protein CGCA056_v010078 [Colletotrichum aenigma]XP_045256138.1 uncharacterized protein GCG54_00005389 [Colletotrichum gloeosporioides]EQB57029.1 hypothetical protein CGLO_02897 [Colletotrichum gloeosporioides Cg-14]KAF3796974.1 hypothetical protein GCG54_00005389 [Colletotrichum gloeosporioides]KAF5492495.1 hypothetical protein CGCS363_v010544 [Colletotrichum siamense]KAF5519647.1 hypothetical p